jgi:lysozyme
MNFEGLRLTAYQDSVGVWTIGWGHTGPDVRPGLTITRAQAESLLRQDLGRFERGVAGLVKVPLSSNQFSALVSFSFNVGLGALGSSTLLRVLNQGNYTGAADQFSVWNKAGGKTLEGLVRRRAAERALFLKA